MNLLINFPDSHKEEFSTTEEASAVIGISSATICNAVKIGKKKLIRKRDKAEFLLEVKDYPRIKIQKESEVFSFSSLRDAENYFGISSETVSVKLGRNDPLLVDRKYQIFLEIIEHNLKPFPRPAEQLKGKVKLNRPSKGPQLVFQEKIIDRLKKARGQLAPGEFDSLHNNGLMYLMA